MTPVPSTCCPGYRIIKIYELIVLQNLLIWYNILQYSIGKQLIHIILKSTLYNPHRQHDRHESTYILTLISAQTDSNTDKFRVKYSYYFTNKSHYIQNRYLADWSFQGHIRMEVVHFINEYLTTWEKSPKKKSNNLKKTSLCLKWNSTHLPKILIYWDRQRHYSVFWKQTKSLSQ